MSTAYSTDNFNSVFSKSIEKLLYVCAVQYVKKRRADWILTILPLNNKNSLYLSLILTLQFFESLSGQVISHKTIWNTSKVKKSEFKQKKKKSMPRFSKPPIIFHLFFYTIPQINFETNPPHPIINFVCKYLGQYLVANFGVASLQISCNIKQGGGVWFISIKWTIPEFLSFFSGIDLVSIIHEEILQFRFACCEGKLY